MKRPFSARARPPGSRRGHALGHLEGEQAYADRGRDGGHHPGRCESPGRPGSPPWPRPSGTTTTPRHVRRGLAEGPPRWRQSVARHRLRPPLWRSRPAATGLRPGQLGPPLPTARRPACQWADPSWIYQGEGPAADARLGHREQAGDVLHRGVEVTRLPARRHHGLPGGVGLDLQAAHHPTGASGGVSWPLLRRGQQGPGARDQGRLQDRGHRQP